MPPFAAANTTILAVYLSIGELDQCVGIHVHIIAEHHAAGGRRNHCESSPACASKSRTIRMTNLGDPWQSHRKGASATCTGTTCFNRAAVEFDQAPNNIESNAKATTVSFT